MFHFKHIMISQIKECKFRIGSYQYRVSSMKFTLSELFTAEASRQNVLLEYLHVNKLSVSIPSAEPRFLTKCYSSWYIVQTPDDIFKWRDIGNYSVCGFKVELRRRSFKFIFNNYIPCALFVLVSWVSFLIPPDLIPGR